MTSADATSPGRVRALVSEPVSQNLDECCGGMVIDRWCGNVRCPVPQWDVDGDPGEGEDPANLDGGRQDVETRDTATPRKAAGESLAIGDTVAGNARPSRGLPFGPLDAPPAPAVHSEESDA
jgi:hypothetical protein